MNVGACVIEGEGMSVGGRVVGVAVGNVVDGR